MLFATEPGTPRRWEGDAQDPRVARATVLPRAAGAHSPCLAPLAFLTSRLNCEERTGTDMSDTEVAEQLLGTVETLTLAVVQPLHGADARRAKQRPANPVRGSGQLPRWKGRPGPTDGGETHRRSPTR